jgi:Legume lectin domain/PEP-CTERM motif
MSRRFSVTRLLTFAAMCSMGAPVTQAFGQVVGFGDGTNWTLNGQDQDVSGSGVITNDNDPPTISSGTLTLTTAAVDESRSAFYNTQQNIASFITSFTYQETNQSPLGSADGFAFVVQTQGTTALGGDAAGLGYNIDGADQPPTGPLITAISPSAAVLFYGRAGDDGGTDFGVNGSGSFADATATDPVNLASGDPIAVTLAYNDTLETLSETLVDTITGQTYEMTRSADITGAIGGDSAYVGFTGSTGGAYADQTISNFTFAPGVPEPASAGLMALCAVGLFARRRSRH